METAGVRSQKLSFLFGFVAAVLVVASIVLFIPRAGQPAYTPDSIYYILVSRAIDSGHGVNIFNYSLFDPHFVAYSTWPPLYPLLLASGLPPMFIQMALLGCIAGLVFLLLVLSTRIHKLTAFVLAVVVVVPWPMLMDATYVWSEVFALLWVFLGVAALAGIGHGESMRRRVWFYWVLAVLALSLAVYTRYAALVFLPGLMLALLRAPLSNRHRWGMVIATPFLAGLFIAPLLVRNLMVSGHLSGAVRAASEATSADLFSSVGLYVGWVFGGEAWQHGAFVVCVLALILVGFVYQIDRRRSKSFGNDVDTKAVWLAWIATSFAVAYVVGIVTLRAWKNFDLSTRMVSPVASLLLLALVAWAVVIWRGTPVLWQRIVLAVPFAALLGLSASTSWNMGWQAARNWRATGSPQWHMSSLLVYSNLYPVTVPKLDGVVLNRRPALMAFRTGWDFRHIPSGPWPHEQLVRIAASARAILIDSRESKQLARQLQHVAPGARLIKVGGAPILLWGKPQSALGE